MNKENLFEEKFTTAVDLLKKYVKEENGIRKPLLPHLLRIGNYLHESGYSNDIVNAGLLHDMFEWTDSPENLIKEQFGQHVYNIVLANTKNREINDPIARREDYVERCARVGIDALIVKAADVLDSYRYYVEINDAIELQRCRNIAQLILKKIKTEADPIFKELNEIL